MRWWIFAVLAYVLLALEVGLADVLAISTDLGTIEPRLVIVLAVLIALHAPQRVALIGCAVLGILLDLTNTWPRAGGLAPTIVGPYALGYMMAAYFIVEMRTMLFRNHPLTFGAMVLLGDAAVQLVVVGIFTARQWYDPMPDWSARAELLVRGMGLFYSAGIGTILAMPLNRIAPLLIPMHGKAARR